MWYQSPWHEAIISGSERGCYGLNVCIPTKIDIVKSLIPSVIVCGGRAFGRQLEPSYGSSALKGETAKPCFSSPLLITPTKDRSCEHTGRRYCLQVKGETSPKLNHVDDIQVSDFQRPKLWENIFLLFKLPSLWYFVMTNWSKTGDFLQNIFRKSGNNLWDCSSIPRNMEDGTEWLQMWKKFFFSQSVSKFTDLMPGN